MSEYDDDISLTADNVHQEEENPSTKANLGDPQGLNIMDSE